jgi:hypothetical protein
MMDPNFWVRFVVLLMLLDNGSVGHIREPSTHRSPGVAQIFTVYDFHVGMVGAYCRVVIPRF